MSSFFEGIEIELGWKFFKKRSFEEKKDSRNFGNTTSLQFIFLKLPETILVYIFQILTQTKPPKNRITMFKSSQSTNSTF
jgi:uncharacterized membrane protein YhfC